MGIYLKRHTQDKPPLGSQIDWGHPLSQGLVGCWLMNEGGGRDFYNLVTYKKITGWDPDITWKNSIKGIGINTSGSFGSVISAGEPGSYFNYPKLTVVALCKSTATTAGNVVCARWHAGNNRRVFQLRIGSSASNWSMISWDGLAVVEAQSSTNFDTTNYHLVAGSIDGANINLFVDGRLTAQTVFAQSAPSQPSEPVRFWTDGQVVGEWRGHTIFVNYYNRALSPSEIQQLYQDPYCFIKPPRNRIYSYLTPAVVTGQPRSYGYLF